MRRLPLSILVLSLGLGLSACASMDTQVRKSAAKDFSCKSEETRIIDKEDTVFRVAACGSTATYECKEMPSLAIHCDRVVYADPASNEVTTATGKYTIKPRGSE